MSCQIIDYKDEYNTTTILDLSNQGLTELPDLSMYINLKILYCKFNNFTTLDNLPINLEYLVCSHNKLTSLDFLPPTLKKLDCRFNYITELDNLPSTLEELDCSFNKLTQLNNMSANIKTVYLGGNPFTYDFMPTLVNIRKLQTST
jgi:Leucine-rich repeat (LRR) protein